MYILSLYINFTDCSPSLLTFTNPVTVLSFDFRVTLIAKRVSLFCSDAVNVYTNLKKALDEYKDEINVTNSLSLFLPLIAAIMIIVAIIVSIRLGLSAIRKLDFDNDATAY